MAVTSTTALAQLSLGISVDESEPTVGQTITYSVTLTNATISSITGVVIEIPIPAGLRVVESTPSAGAYDHLSGFWQVGTIAAVSSETLDIQAQVRVFRPLTVEASLGTSTPPDITPLDNEDAVEINPQPPVTPGPTDFFTPVSVEGTSFSTLLASPHGPAGKNSGDSSDFLFAGSTDGGLHRSSDGGENWPRVGLQDKVIRAMSISEATGAVYVGDYGEGMFRSTDDGLTFAAININLTNKRVISSVLDEFSPTGSDGDIYIGTDGGGVFRSLNNGGSWSALNIFLPANAVVRALLVDEDGGTAGSEAIYAGLLGKGIYKLDESIGTWSAVNGTTPGSELLGDKYIYDLAQGSTTGTLFAGAGTGIFTSSDQGATWALALAEIPIRSLTTYFDGSTEYIFAGTDGEFIYVSTDDGATWSQQLIGIDDRTVETILVTDDGVAFAGTATQGIFRSDDLGSTWYRVSSLIQNATIQAMTFNDEGELYVGTYGFGIFFTDDAVNFTRVNTGLDNHWVFALEHTPGDALFAGTWNRGVYRSIDDARTWQFVGLPYRNVYDLAARDQYTIYAATDRGEVARSLDNGLSWHNVGVATTAVYALLIDESNPNVILAGTFGQGTYRSTDGGSTFTKTNMVDTHVFDFAYDPVFDEIWAATSTGPMYSSDGGINWTADTDGLDVKDSRAIAVSETGIILVGTWGGGVSRWDFFSSSWVEYGLTEMPIMAFAISPTTGELFAGTDGQGVYRGMLPLVTGREEEDGKLPADYAISQNFPNPFNPTTSIEFDLREPGAVKLAVYDMVGREVRVLADGALSAGKHHVTLEAADLPSGVYIYRLEADGKSFAKKMILMK